jgi:hypothetical protein
VNGDFSTPSLCAKEWKYYNGGVKGWKANKMEIGDCRIYNNAWPKGQCA